MPVSTRTYKDAAGTTKTRVVSENGSAQDAGGVLLLDENAAVLKGRKADALSVPIALSTENVALLQALLDAQPAAGVSATAAKQDTGNTSLGNIDTKTPALGQALAAASTPVVLTAIQQSALTPPAAITGFATETTLAALNTKVPSSPAAEHTTAASPHAARLSDGAAFYKATTPSDTQPVSIATAPVLVAGEAHIGEVGGNLPSVATEFTRPADTAAYTAGDVWSDNTTTTTMQALAGAARVSGGSGYIVGARISTDKRNSTQRIRVHIFNTTGATLAADNAAYKEVYADTSKRVFYFDMPAMTTATDTTNSDMSRTVDTTLRIPYTCAATSLYFVFEALDAFTPASGQKATLTLYLDRN